MLEGQHYHYKESGLENVYLSGIRVTECGKCGAKAPQIPRIQELHRKIALEIVAQPNRLKGAEIRFLRKQMRMQAKDLARQLGYTASQFSRFENDKDQIGEQGDRLLRMYFLTRQARALGHKNLESLMQDALTRFGDPAESNPIEVDMTDLVIQETNPAHEPIQGVQ